jgi:two-component system, LytTR family, sensor kinase
MKLLRGYWWLFPLFTAIGLLFFSYHYLDDLARQIHGTFAQRFIEEMTGAYTAMVLVPSIVWFTRHFPWQAQIAGILAYSLVHTTLMWLTRAAIFPLAGLGHYDYGLMGYRYPMEASHDFIMYPMMIGFVYFYDHVRRSRESEVANAQLQRELAEAKFDNLRLQLHPHFLFNTLNAVSAVMYEDVRKADAMLARLSEFLRVILTTSDVQEITLDEELQIERMYLDIMKARLENTLRLNIAAEPDVRLAKVPALILQPIIENCIRHGMRSERGELDIEIDVVRTQTGVEVRIRDNGRGVSTTNVRFGRGLSNTVSRLSHLYGEQAELRVAQLEPHVTEVTLHFPLRT